MALDFEKILNAMSEMAERNNRFIDYQTSLIAKIGREKAELIKQNEALNTEIIILKDELREKTKTEQLFFKPKRKYNKTGKYKRR